MGNGGKRQSTIDSTLLEEAPTLQTSLDGPDKQRSEIPRLSPAVGEVLAFEQIGSKGRFELLEADDGAVMPRTISREDVLNSGNLEGEKA